MDGFRGLHPSLKNVLISPNAVRGLIVTNFFGGNADWVEHPVIDPSALTAYFSDGELVASVTFYRGFLEEDRENSVLYYNSYSTFRENFWKYLLYAPHSRVFESPLQKRYRTYSFPGTGLEPFSVMTPEVIMPPDNSEVRASVYKSLDGLRSCLWSN